MDTHPFVETVEARLEHALAGDRGGVLAEAARALCIEAGGKRIRPRLTGLLGAAAGAPNEALCDAAASGELIHGASLLHDDVVDDATVRRRRPTANARFGNAVAVLAGDWLLSSAFALLLPHPRAITTEAIEVVGEMSRAAAEELEVRGRVDLGLGDWRALAEGKTGALFAWCGRAAARLAGREDLIGPFGCFGRRLGVAFQLADDLKDLFGGDGKDRFADLRNRNPSMPLLWAAATSVEARTRLAAAWAREVPDPAEVEDLGEWILQVGAAEANAAWLEEEVTAALACLAPLGDGPWLEEIIGLAAGFTTGLGPTRSPARAAGGESRP